jgi:hypothetical protein
MWKRKFVVDPLAPRVAATNPDATVESFLAENMLSLERRRALARTEQGSAEWLAIKGRFMSGTGVGPASGESDYDTPDDFLRKRLWPELDPPSPAMLLGVRDEKYCSISLEAGLLSMIEAGTAARIPIPQRAPPFDTPLPMKQLGFEVASAPLYFDQAGFLVPVDQRVDDDDNDGSTVPWIGMSPDAIISFMGNMVLGEFKRPMDGRFYSQKKHRVTGIPKAYVAQIQSIMNMMKIEWCFFAVMSEKQGVETRLFRRDRAYWRRVGTIAKAFYFNRLVPALVAKARGLLRVGEIEPSFGVCRPFDARSIAAEQQSADEAVARACAPEGWTGKKIIRRLYIAP